MSFINKATCSLARLSANRPIHVIIVGALLASVAYLAVVDEYVPQTLFSSNASVTYYHPPGSKDFKDWIKVDSPEEFTDASKVSILPLRFSRFHNQDLPEVENSFPGVTPNERLFILSPDEVDSTIKSLDGLSYNGITWKIRSHTRLSHVYEYARYASTRIQSLIKGAENFDVVLILVAYLAMFRTLIGVFFEMKQAGSNFWLAFSTLTSSTFAFLFALVTTTHFLNIKVPLISMTEGIPFLVAIIGFKHKVSIATYVSKQSSTDLDVKTIVSNAISAHHVSFLRDHFTVVAPLIFISVYAKHLEGLRNFSVLAVLILTYDLLMVYTFFSAILALKVEINRARRTENLKRALEEDGISSWIANNVATSATTVVKKAEPLFDFKNTSILSFKFAMVAGFFGFHAFWFGSSWLFDAASDKLTASNIFILTRSAAKHIDISKKGTLVTVIQPRSYVPLGFVVRAEDFVAGAFGFISSAIRDSILSKLILFGFTVSICINAYFLNASRHHVSTTRHLLQTQMSNTDLHTKRSKPSKISRDIESKDSVNIGSDTEDTSASEDVGLEIRATKTIKPLDECVKYLKDGKVKELNNNEVSSLVVAGKLPLYALEKQLSDNRRAVEVRRKAISNIAGAPVLDSKKLPFEHYDYNRVFGACCENVIGYMPIPVGIAGPLIIDGKPYHIPMATTEGCLVASAMRGCKAINAGGGVQTVLTQDGMTRGPCVSFPSLTRAGAAKIWLDSEEGQKIIKKAFNSTSRFARLQHIQTALAGTLLFIRFRTTTGDAMGMNMISKGVEHCLKFMVEECGWEDMEVISVSGNYCTDKKPAAINWIEGRGKSVVAEARIPAEIVTKVLKSDVKALVELNIDKNLVGSALAGSIGGFNAQAANLVTAVFLACGQDPAQNVESSNCITLMKEVNGDLQISVSMPSIEVGTIGGGTILEPQGAMLELLGVRGPHPTNPGENARQLARIVASIVLSAELSLCSALAAGHLVQSHMQHNRAAPAAAAPANGTLSKPDVKRLQEGAVNCIRS